MKYIRIDAEMKFRNRLGENFLSPANMVKIINGLSRKDPSRQVKIFLFSGRGGLRRRAGPDYYLPGGNFLCLASTGCRNLLVRP